MATVIIVVIVLGLGWFKFGPFILDFIKMIRRDAYQCNPNKQAELSNEKVKALSVGLIIAEQNQFYSDTLETGSSRKEQADKLASLWGIDNSQDALERLSTFGSIHQLYDIAINVYLNIDKNEWQTYIKEHHSDDASEIFEFAEDYPAG